MRVKPTLGIAFKMNFSIVPRFWPEPRNARFSDPGTHLGDGGFGRGAPESEIFSYSLITSSFTHR